MNKIYLVLIIVKDNRNIEVIFDKRFSFKNNFRLLKTIYPDIEIDEFYIYDDNLGIFLDKNLPIKYFEMENLESLRVF